MFKLPRKAPFSELRRRVTEQLGVPPDQQRFWKWAGRQNATYRPVAPLVLESEDQPISVGAGAGVLLHCFDACWCFDRLGSLLRGR
jgi:hypothetical protein